MLFVYLAIDIIIAIFCLITGFNPDVEWLRTVTWVCIGVLTIWNVFSMIVKGIPGILGGLIINYIVPFVVVILITHFAFGFVDIRTLYFAFAGVALTSIFSQLHGSGL